MNKSEKDVGIEMETVQQIYQSPKDCEPDSNQKQGKKRSGRHGARNQHRHKQVVKWIVDKFPKEIASAKDVDNDINAESNDEDKEQKPIQTTMHILDVAGGKGELAARMTICHRLNVKMVDPRAANLSECFHKLIFRSLPKKWQQKISQNPTAIENALQRRFKQYVMYFPSDSERQMCLNELESNQELLDAVIGCSLMIGMHSDGATEAIVDIAMKYRKPFMVVPCCVFPNFFKHRFIPRSATKEDENDNLDSFVRNVQSSRDDMIPVRSHEQFCKYLLLKDSHFTEEILPFEGRNVAICWDGERLDCDDSVNNQIE